MQPLDRVLRWASDVRRAFSKHGLDAVPVWIALASIHTESKGYPRPERHVAKDYPAEGLLQMLSSTAQYCDLSLEDVDGLGTPMADARRSIDCYAQIQSDFNGPEKWRRGWPYPYDYPLLWYTGPGTLQSAEGRRKSGESYWTSWYNAVTYDVDVPALTPRAVYDYLQKWAPAARAYYQATAGQV